MKPIMPGHRRAGMTLAEVVIALALLLIVSVSYLASTTFNARMARAAQIDVYAVELTNRIIEEMRMANYDNLGTHVGAEARFMAPQTFQMDPENPDRLPPFTVTTEFMGFGMVSSSGPNSLTAIIPTDTAFPDWSGIDWTGRLVMIKDGDDSGQIAHITSNDATTLQIVRALDGSGSGSWIRNPDAGNYFEIDNGKTVRVTVDWINNGTAQSISRMSLIPSP